MRFAETGFHLEINLSRGSVERVATDPAAVAEYLGGEGAAARIISERVAPDTDPFSPNNLLVFSAGLLAGTPVPGANRASVSSISPETNRYVSSGLDGFFATELKHAGWDAIVVRGKAPSPVYLLINNGEVELRDASHLMGKSALQTAADIEEEVKIPNLQVAAIGLAGENRVLQATIDHVSSSASGGLGAVMGGKGLKAIAVRGTGEVLVARPGECFAASLSRHTAINKNRRCGDLLLRKEDKSPLAPPFSTVPAFWTKKRQKEWAVEVQSEHVFFQWENYSQEMEEVRETVIDKSRLLRETGCYNCPKECHQTVYLPGGDTYFVKNYARLAYAMAAYPEVKLNYNALAAMQEYGVDEPAMVELAALTNALQGAGVLTAEDLPEYPAEPAARVSYLVEKMARRDGIGDTLAGGVKDAVAAIGRGAGDLLQLLKTGIDGGPAKDAALIDASLGICPLLSSFRKEYGGQPCYDLQDLPQFVSLAAGIDLDPARLAEVAAGIREVIVKVNEGRSAREKEEASAREAA